MNRHIYTILALTLIIFVSGCTDGDTKLSVFGLELGPGDPIFITTENLEIDVEAIPDEVYEGQSTTLFFDITNIGNTTIYWGGSNNVPAIDVILTDYEDFNPEGTRESIRSNLNPGSTKSWNWKMETKGDIYSEKDSTVRYLVRYNSSSASMYDIVVMSDEEYVRLEREDKLDEDIKLNYFKTKSPVEIDLSISKEQPLFEGLELYLYIKLKDVGGGTLNHFSANWPYSLIISYPHFLNYVTSCTDFQHTGGRLVLNRNLDFYDKETKNIVCKFEVDDVNVREIGQFKAEANYIYEYYKTINIKIKPK